MKKIVFSFIIVIYCMLVVSAKTTTWVKKIKVASAIDWSERGEMPEDSESGQEDNREPQDDETYRLNGVVIFYNLSLNEDYLQTSFLFFADSHFPEINSPPPQG